MGLLTNPNSEDGSMKLVGLLDKHGAKLGVVAYLAGLIWMVFLANAEYNLKTYFSENALLPGLVVENFGGGHRAEEFLRQLQKEDAKREQGESIPPEYFEKFFRNIGLAEVELQNYTLVDPFTKRPEGIKGTNVFAVLRAKRAAGTEALVFNAPYFPKHTQTRRNLASIALMMSLAEYFQKQVYWAKDIVFLVAEGHIGTLAWVKGHQEMYDDKDCLKFERVRTKAGNIQAAVNVIMEGDYVCGLETRFHGINGQLPNLDFVNLINKFIVTDAEKRPDWEKDVWKLVAYMKTQATGAPTGSHGFFLKYGVESVTMLGKSPKSCKERHSVLFGDIGRILEAVYRSLNNLLERLHQSFFFYLKTTPNRFISISLYFPPLALIILPILLKGSKIWLTEKDLAATQGLFRLMSVHAVAVFLRWTLSNFNQIVNLAGFSGEDFLLSSESFFQIALVFTAFQFLFTTILLRKSEQNLVDAIYCFCLLECATSLYCVALFNPSLVFFVATASAPIVTLLFFFHPKQRFWLGGIILAVFAGLIFNYQNILETPIAKYFHDAELYGNFVFDYAFVLGIPILSTIVAIA